MWLNTPRPAHIVLVISAIAEAFSCRLSCPNKKTPIIVRGEMLWVLFLLEIFVT